MKPPRTTPVASSAGALSNKIAAPVALFIFRRPLHLRSAITSLLKCKGIQDTPIIVFGDGPRHDAERGEVQAARQLARDMLGDSAVFHFRETNVGLSRSIIEGVGDTCREYGRVIVLEDDLELAPSFLEYMNTALEKYAGEDRVLQISGHMFDVPEFEGSEEGMFLPITTSWGWATWQRAWDHFDPDATGWQSLQTDKALRRRFDIDGVYDYSGMLESQMTGRRDSWAVRWYWSVFRANGMTLFPPRTLVRNSGHDGSGTHGGGVLRRFRSSTVVLGDGPRLMPTDVQVNWERYLAVRRRIRSLNGGWIGRTVDIARRLWRRRAAT